MSSALDLVAAAFGRLLRRFGVAASPAEVIEIRRTLAILGAGDPSALRAGLRAVSVKYPHERPGFERAFAAFFGAGQLGESGAVGAGNPGEDGGRPTGLRFDDDDPLGRFADYNTRTTEVGDFLDTAEDGRGFNPHRDDDDVSIGGADRDLTVSTGADLGRRGVTFTVDLDRAGSAVAGELSSARSAPVAGSVDWDDPAAILAWLEAFDPRQVYADGPDADLSALSAAERDRLVEAIVDFVAALAERVSVGVAMPTEPTDATEHGDLQRAVHELLRRMHGAPRRVPREHSHGHLDVRHTVRRSMRTDGVPFHLVVRARRPDRVRLLVVADVSLSVRSVTAFALRLAQALNRMAFRCRVLAFVDEPVDVTEVLLRARGDDALGAVLAAPGLNLDGTSDYGRVMHDLVTGHADLVDRRTAVLFVGDARCNGLPSGLEDLRRLRRAAHRIGWITPEPRRYWNQASCAMTEFATVVDEVVVARDADELTRQVAVLAHALS